MSILAGIAQHFARPTRPVEDEIPDPLREQFAALEQLVAERERNARKAACPHPAPLVWWYGAPDMMCVLCFSTYREIALAKEGTA